MNEKLIAVARNSVLIALISMLLMELALRAIDFSHVQFYGPDPLIGWWGRPGADGVYREEGGAEVRISSAGVRDRERAVPKPADVWRIAVLGDSYTEALQVAEDKRFTSVVERKLAACDAGGAGRVEVLNFGISGFGTVQQYLLLKNRVLRYAPDVVVLAFLPGNDLTDNVRHLDPSVALRPYATLSERGQILLDRSFADTASFRIKSSAIYRAVLRVSDYSRVVQALFFVKDRWRRQGLVESIRNGNEEKAKTTGEYGLSTAIYSAPRTPHWQQAWQVAERLIEEMAGLAAQSTARFLLVTLSSGIQIQPDAKRPDGAARKLGLPDLFYADDRLHAFAVEKGIEVLSLARPLAEHAQREKVFLHGFPDAWGLGHWNEAGHQAAGELIARYLCARPASSPNTGPL